MQLVVFPKQHLHLFISLLMLPRLALKPHITCFYDISGATILEETWCNVAFSSCLVFWFTQECLNAAITHHGPKC